MAKYLSWGTVWEDLGPWLDVWWRTISEGASWSIPIHSTSLWSHLCCHLHHLVKSHCTVFSLHPLLPSHLSSYFVFLNIFYSLSSLTLMWMPAWNPLPVLSQNPETRTHSHTLRDWKHHASLPCWKSICNQPDSLPSICSASSDELDAFFLFFPSHPPPPAGFLRGHGVIAWGGGGVLTGH